MEREVRVTLFGAWGDNEPAAEAAQARDDENRLLAECAAALVDRCGADLRLRTGGGPHGCMGVAERAVVERARALDIAPERVYYGATTRWLSAYDRPEARAPADLPPWVHWLETPEAAAAPPFNLAPFAPPPYPADGTRADQLAARQRHVIGPSPHLALLAPGFYGTLYEGMQVLAEAVHGNYPQFQCLVAIGSQWRGVVDALATGRERGRSNRAFPLLVRRAETRADFEAVLGDVLPPIRAGVVTFPAHR